MAGGREQLAKAVVLEAVKAAHGAGRPCLLFAFSGQSGECDHTRPLMARDCMYADGH